MYLEISLKKHHPKEFELKYGKEKYSISLNNRVVGELNEKEYIKARFKEAVASSNKKEALELICLKNSDVNKNDSTFDFENFIKLGENFAHILDLKYKVVTNL